MTKTTIKVSKVLKISLSFSEIGKPPAPNQRGIPLWLQPNRRASKAYG